jgi:hypothetical protein
VTEFDPAATMLAVDEGADKLEAASEVMEAAVMDFENAEEAFELEMAKLRLEADLASGEETKDGKRKLPSQDRRQDVALTTLRRDKPEVYTAYFATKAVKEAKNVKYRALAAAVSARQSLLKAVNP